MGSGSSKDHKDLYLLETLQEHKDAINVMTLSEDGSLLVTGSEDFTARMWSTKTENTESLGALEGHEGYITCVTISDTYILTGSSDSTIRKWDMTTCECLFIYQGHTSKVNRVICTGEFIFSTSSDKTAKAWLFDAYDLDDDALMRVCLRTFKEHLKPVFPIIFIPAENTDGLDEDGMNINPGDIIITGSNDTQARSWSFDTGGCLRVFKGHRGPIICMATDPAGKMLYTGSSDHTIRCWNIQTGECRKVLEGHNGHILALSVVNKLMYSASSDSHAKCWVREFGDCTRDYKGHYHSVTCLKFHEGILYTGCGDAIARGFDAKSGAIKREFKGPDKGINAIAVCDNKLYTADAEGVLRVWDIKGLGDELHAAQGGAAVGADGPAIDENSDRQLDALDHRLDNYMGKSPDPENKSNIPGEVRPESPELDDDLAMLEEQLNA
ncbi:WD repeat-containing protein 86-like [Macrobrachium nipponense]|uniref:WD repeat-containing protein 86-like n=1 Tax=Macrobrachium nipponense TaxID=159736 RepID=UPI0030C7E279